ncbi:MAG TPA: gluconate 2-dehydrogenase subunit 3 family protein [Pseudolabrys sp.]|nr:gluconate 2-dehydrogenase subunit 3 family protein [Pseudolabrys sp.]
MLPMERRAFMQGAAMGALAFSVGGVDVLLTAREARAQGAAFKTLTPEQVATLEALGETLVPGAREAGVAHYVDAQISGPADNALLIARVMNVRPPYANFYRVCLGALEKACQAQTGKNFAALAANEQHDLIEKLRTNKLEGWQGPPPPYVYAVMRGDAIDVVYGTMAGYEGLGIPYMAHIAPEKRW